MAPDQQSEVAPDSSTGATSLTAQERNLRNYFDICGKREAHNRMLVVQGEKPNCEGFKPNSYPVSCPRKAVYRCDFGCGVIAMFCKRHADVLTTHKKMLL